MSRDDGGPAFPQMVESYSVYDSREGGKCIAVNDQPASGMSLRDYFAIRAPQPTEAQVKYEAERDRVANPHGDSYKPHRRSILEIECGLRYVWADAMLEARKK